MLQVPSDVDDSPTDKKPLNCLAETLTCLSLKTECDNNQTIKNAFKFQKEIQGCCCILFQKLLRSVSTCRIKDLTFPEGIMSPDIFPAGVVDWDL